jgi:ribose transport system substrate-binding protein
VNVRLRSTESERKNSCPLPGGEGKTAPRRSRLGALLLALGGLLGAHAALAQQEPPGLTEPTVFAPFDANAPKCAAPPGLQRVLAFAQDNEREFMRGVGRGLAAAAKDRGLEYRLALADNDPVRMIRQVQELRTNKVGAMVVAPVDPSSVSRSLQQMIWAGAYVGAVVPPPATSILNAPQYLTGKVLGDAAADYIRTRLGGNAKVVLLTHDSLQFLAPRFVAMRDSLKPIPGAVIVADLSPQTVDKEGGAAAMRTILLAHPTVDVVLGADTVVLGALAALRAAGRARPEQFRGGIDGEPEAVAEIRKGGPYKASIALSSPVFGYAMGQHAADWLEGRSIPQAMDILPTALSLANLAQYEADLADPGKVYADPARRASYLKMYGNICYDTRHRYVNFPWSSERK